MKRRILTVLLVPVWSGALAAGPDGQEALNSVGPDTPLAAATNGAHYGAKTSTTFESVAPLTLDPILGQQAYLKENSVHLGDGFGSAVAVSSNTVVVGVPLGGDGTTLNVGTVCVFVRDGSTWTQQACLKAGDPGAFDGFGTSVAVSGDTIVIGAPNEDSSATGVNGDQFNNNLAESGAAYVFVRNGTNWTPQAYLKASNAGRDDYFGLSVAVSGDTIVVGAPLEDSSATGVNGNQANDSLGSSGAAYVFVRTGTNWSQQAYLKASNTGAGDQFGHSVAVSGDTVVVGAPGESSSATGVNGNQNDDNADNSGAAYVFVRNGTSWTQQAYFKASNTEGGLGGVLPGDLFGSSVAVSGDTVVVGAPYEDSSATGVNGNQTDNSASDSGAAYVFVRDTVNIGNWHTAYLKASNTEAGDNFGWSVSVSGGRILVGAPLEDSNATRANGSQSDNSAPDSGAMYLFVRGGTIFSPTWRFRDYLKASNTGAGDQFGTAVAISGDMAVVGAPYEDSHAVGVNGDQNNNTATNAGAAYVFGPPMPDIVVEQLGANIPDGGNSPQFVVAGLATTSLTFTIRNAGDVDLTGLTTTIDGADAARFAVTASPVAPVAPASNTPFTVRFAPGTLGTSTAMLHLANNDPDESPFDIVLRGLALSFSQDTDGDGLNDASEFQLSALGFDWQVSQPALVSVLFNNANGAGLFTQSQLQALNVNTPLLAKDPATGFFKLTVGVEKATQLTNFVPFPMTAPQTTINAEGKLEFRFASPDNAAFYRLEAR
jgi:hypothetical protein